MNDICNLEFKVLDHGFVRVVDVMGNDESIVQAARVSYGKGTKGTSTDRNLIRYLMMHRHTSPFEMCEIKLHVKAPIFVVRHWVRHRTANFNEYSARYSEMPNEFYYPSYDFVRKQSGSNKQCSEELFTPEEYQNILTQIKTTTESAYQQYLNLLSAGVSRETARIILPVNVYTQFYWKIDAHNLMHFLKLRSDYNTQSETREYAIQILHLFKQWMPITYEAFMDYVVNAKYYSDKSHTVLAQSIEKNKMDEILSVDTDLSAREKNILRERFK